MADDKTAAELRDRIANRLELGLANSANYTPDEILLRQAWQALGHAEDPPLAAVRRVAPDRETLAFDPDRDEFTPTTEQAREAFILGSDEEGSGADFDRWLELHDAALLASGVLGVPTDLPTTDAGLHAYVSRIAERLSSAENARDQLRLQLADQRTADREAIARALFARSLDRLGHGYPTEAITWEVTDQESWRRDADAVLAVLVPAENA